MPRPRPRPRRIPPERRCRAFGLVRPAWAWDSGGTPGRLGFYSEVVPPAEGTQRTVCVPDYAIAFALAAPPVAVWLRRRRTRPGFCPACGYDLRETPGRRPECGAVPTHAKGAA